MVLESVDRRGQEMKGEQVFLYWTRERTKMERTILSSTNNITESNKSISQPLKNQRGFMSKESWGGLFLSPCACVLSSSRKTSKSPPPAILVLISLNYRTIPTFTLGPNLYSL